MTGCGGDHEVGGIKKVGALVAVAVATGKAVTLSHPDGADVFLRVVG